METALKIDLQRQIITLGLEKSVHLLGRISNPFPLLKRADCFVLSSNHEGQPMVLFEAMILDKPIISTDITGSRSALEGRSGVLVENSVDGLFNGMRDFIWEGWSLNILTLNLIKKMLCRCFMKNAFIKALIYIMIVKNH